MLKVGEMINKTHEITDMLERMANMDLQKAQAYRDGYVKACEDFGREMRQAINMEQD